MEYQSWFMHGFHKLRQTERPADGMSYTLHMAGNGGDCCQLALYSDEPCTIRLEATPLRHPDGATLFPQLSAVKSVCAGTHGEWPDPLAPLSDTVCLEPHRAMSVFIRVNAPAGSPAGDYNGTIRLQQGTEARCLSLTAHVWDFTLPQTASCQTSFGLDRFSIEAVHGVQAGSEQSDRLFRAYYEALLSRKVSADVLPVDILSPEADSYLDDQRMTSFVVPFSEDDVMLNRYLAKIKSKREWFSKAVFYPVDEPATRESYEKLWAASHRLHHMEPNARIVTPFYSNPQYDIRLSAVEEMLGHVQVWCPESCLFDNVNIWDRIGRGADGTLADKLHNRQNTSETLWWYVCCGPGEPYCNLFIHMEGICHRLLFWQQRYLDVSGLLYWSANYWHAKKSEGDLWDGTCDPWNDMATVKQINPDLYGDGSLLYNGNIVGVEGPVSSLRMEAVADGIDDYEYLTMARRLLGREKADAFIRQVLTSLTVYTDDEERFVEVRAQLGDAIEKALA